MIFQSLQDLVLCYIMVLYKSSHFSELAGMPWGLPRRALEAWWTWPCSSTACDGSLSGPGWWSGWHVVRDLNQDRKRRMEWKPKWISFTLTKAKILLVESPSRWDIWKCHVPIELPYTLVHAATLSRFNAGWGCSISATGSMSRAVWFSLAAGFLTQKRDVLCAYCIQLEISWR